MKFNEMTTIPYNSVTVQRFATSPAAPQFSGRSPWMASQRVTIFQFGIGSLNADISFEASMMTAPTSPDRITVYQRETVGTGIFSPLPTSFNSLKNEITATTSRFGEFIFCWSDTDTLAGPPILAAPADRDSVNQKLPLAFFWNPRGTVTGYQLQVAFDSLFTNFVLNDSLLTLPSDTLGSLVGGSRYYWRVRSRNFGQTSGWSVIRKFTASPPYIAVTSPSGRESWQRGNQYFIKWVSNNKDRVRIDLYKGPNRLSIVKDSATNVGAFTWTIASSLAPDSTYRIRITSVADSSVFSASAGTFSVTSGATVVETADHTPGEFALYQNYPNPFNPSTSFEFQVAGFGFVSLKIYDVLGKEVATLANEVCAPGRYHVRWNASAMPSGVYFYQLRAGASVATKHMVLMK
jgi:hypothetical protein